MWKWGWGFPGRPKFYPTKKLELDWSALKYSYTLESVSHITEFCSSQPSCIHCLVTLLLYFWVPCLLFVHIGNIYPLSFSAIFFGSTSSLFTPFLRSSPSLLVDVMTFISDERNKCEGRVTNFAWYNVHGYPLLEESSSNFWQKKGIVGSNPPITDIG